MSFYRQQLEDYLKTIRVEADVVFDIGGAQYPIDKKRTGTWKVRDLKILDLPEFDMNEPLTFDLQADIVFCLEVFEYLIAPTVAMDNLAKALKPGGVAYVSFPLIYPVHNEVEYDSLRYTESGVRRLAKRSKLEVNHVHYRKTKTNSLTRYYSEDGMRAAKGMNHDVTGYVVTLINR